MVSFAVRETDGLNLACSSHDFIRPFGGLDPFSILIPSHEWLGYFHSSALRT